VVFEQLMLPLDIPLFWLFADELDLILNFRKLSPWEYVEPDEAESVDAPGTNFKPTIISPR
jgi:hypothetical protein